MNHVARDFPFVVCFTGEVVVFGESFSRIAPVSDISVKSLVFESGDASSAGRDGVSSADFLFEPIMTEGAWS